MSTLYLRNVPEGVKEQLATLAAREGLSVSAFAVRELTSTARRAGNAALLANLPDLPVPTESIVAALEAGRGER